MDDLISRQSALYQLHLLSIEALRKQRHDYCALIDICSNIIKSLPAAMPEQKTGRWIPFDWDTWECSECKNLFTTLEGTPKDNLFNFCPNCGAKIESEGANNE